MIINNLKKKLTSGGYYFPIEILQPREAVKLNLYYKKAKKNLNGNLKFEHKFKSHLLFQKLNQLIFNKTMLDIAEKIIGPNILCWNSIIFYKKKKSKSFVGWHEDKSYWYLENNNILSFSIALTKSTLENGCLKFLKSKRKVGYEIKNPKYNMLARGQNAILDKKDLSENIELSPGQACMFSQDAVHGSGTNNSNNERVLIAIRYISTNNKTTKNHQSATLVRGVDNFNYYKSEPIPSKDFDPICVSYHQRLMSKQTQIFAKFKLKKLNLGFLSLIVKLKFVRYIYYLIHRKI